MQQVVTVTGDRDTSSTLVRRRGYVRITGTAIWECRECYGHCCSDKDHNRRGLWQARTQRSVVRNMHLNDTITSGNKDQGMMVRIGQVIDGILCQVALCLDDCHCYTSLCSLQAIRYQERDTRTRFPYGTFSVYPHAPNPGNDR